jgi:predicted RNA-binding Zn ribbon-like protein
MPNKPDVKRQKGKENFRFQDARLCFAFAGTLGDRGTNTPFERLNQPSDLERWCVESGWAQEAVQCTTDQLQTAKILREAIQRAGVALARRKRLSGEDISIINLAADCPPMSPKLQADGKTVEWNRTSVAAILSTVARDFIEICTSSLRTRVHICSNPSCGIPFVDTSRAGVRRWCSMQTCGATIKKRNYRARQRAS